MQKERKKTMNFEKNQHNQDENDTEKRNNSLSGENGESLQQENNVLLKNIEKSSAVITKNKDVSLHCLTIIGQVEGHYILGDSQKATKYEQILPLLVSIEESDEIDGLLIILNTIGGDVEAGLAIAEMIASMSKPTVSIVLGGGHSIGVPLAVSAKKSFIVPSATMTIHPVRMNGLVVGAPQTYYYFNQMQERILNFVCDHSKCKIDVLRSLMMKTDEIATDVGSIVDGIEAKRIGLIDKVGGLSDAIRTLKTMIYNERKRQNAKDNQDG